MALLLLEQEASEELDPVVSVDEGGVPDQFPWYDRVDTGPASYVGALRPGSMIAGKYRVTREIAHGGMGIVYACTDTVLGRTVAVKLNRPGVLDEETAHRLLREARMLAQLNNPHIACVYDCGFGERGEPYIAMELLEGRDLFSLIEARGALPPSVAVRLGIQICDGLAAVHAHGIIHRDLKPENLFLVTGADGSETIKILDFGISKQPARRHERALTNPSASVGSPTYMSPEQINCAPVDHRTDIWSLGIVLFELLTGRPPFDNESMAAVFGVVLNGALPRVSTLRPDVPPALDALVARCLQTDPDRRFASVNDIAQELRDFLAASGAGLARRSQDRTPYTAVASTDVRRAPAARWPIALGLIAATVGGVLAFQAVVRPGAGAARASDRTPSAADAPYVSALTPTQAAGPTSSAPSAARAGSGVPLPSAPARRATLRMAKLARLAVPEPDAAVAATSAPPTPPSDNPY